MKSIARSQLTAAIMALSIGSTSVLVIASPLSCNTATNSSTIVAVDFFENYLAAKNTHNGSKFLQYFDTRSLTYCDAVIGVCPNSTDLFYEDNSWRDTTADFYLLDVYGDTHSAVVHFVATPAAFGQEIRTLSTVDLQNGKITRQIDYWNARNNSATTPCPEHQAKYPSKLGLEKVGENAAPTIQELAHKLSDAYAASDAAAAAALFDYSAMFEDLTLRVALEGRHDIQEWLQLALPIVPYGRGAVLRHVLGSNSGGGYEWKQSYGPVPNGVVALSVNEAGAIASLKTVWDASCLSDWELGAMLLLPLSM